MDIFFEKYQLFLSEFGRGRKMVLSTSVNDKVSSRMMSVVQINGRFCFQTDAELRKYKQLAANNNVALCIDNIQIEGICRELGHPLDNEDFCSIFKSCFKGSFDAYTSLENERLFEVELLFAERWLYIDGIPYIETFDFETRQYSCKKYCGV